MGNESETAHSRGTIANLRPFPPGVSGNPGGRAKSLAKAIQGQTNDGQTLISFWLRLMANGKAKWRDRLEASRLLAQYGFSKPPEEIDLNVISKAVEAMAQAEGLSAEEGQAAVRAVEAMMRGLSV